MDQGPYPAVRFLGGARFRFAPSPQLRGKGSGAPVEGIRHQPGHGQRAGDGRAQRQGQRGPPLLHRVRAPGQGRRAGGSTPPHRSRGPGQPGARPAQHRQGHVQGQGRDRRSGHAPHARRHRRGHRPAGGAAARRVAARGGARCLAHAHPGPGRAGRDRRGPHQGERVRGRPGRWPAARSLPQAFRPLPVGGPVRAVPGVGPRHRPAPPAEHAPLSQRAGDAARPAH